MIVLILGLGSFKGHHTNQMNQSSDNLLAELENGNCELDKNVEYE